MTKRQKTEPAFTVRYMSQGEWDTIEAGVTVDRIKSRAATRQRTQRAVGRKVTRSDRLGAEQATVCRSVSQQRDNRSYCELPTA